MVFHVLIAHLLLVLNVISLSGFTNLSTDILKDILGASRFDNYE